MKNNNKPMLRQLALSSLKASKMRNIFILITIILSVSLLSGVALTTNAMNVKNKRNLESMQHVLYHNLTSEQVEKLRTDELISEFLSCKNGKALEKDGYLVVPYYLEQNDSVMSNANIVEGRYPENFNEALVDKKLMEELGVNPSLGETIKLTFNDGSTEEFKVVGFYEIEGRENVYTLYLSEEYANSGSQLKNIDWTVGARIHNAETMSNDEFLTTIRELGAKYGIERKNVNENNMFLDSISTNLKQVGMVLVIGIGILVVSVLVIYSVFYISIAEKTRQYGQLRTLGMTKKQVKNMVRLEGTVLCLIGAPIGFIIGAIFSYFMEPKGFSFSDVCMWALIILIADYLTVLISISKPAKDAASVSPMEATKLSGYEIKGSKKGTKNLERKLSPFSLSIIAAKGNRKKSRMTMISLCIAGILFVIASTVMNSINEEEYSRQSWYKYGEYVVEFSNNAADLNEHSYTGLKVNNPLNEELANSIKEIDGVKDVIFAKNIQVTYDYKDIKDIDSVGVFSRSNVEELNKYTISGNLDYDKMIKNKEIYIINNEVSKEVFGFGFEVGDEVELSWFNGEKVVSDKFTVAGVLNNKTLRSEEITKIALEAGFFLLPEELLEEMMIPGFNTNNVMTISVDNFEENGDKIEEELRSLIYSNPTLRMSTLRETIIENQSVFNTLFITTMGLALFIIGFSFINLINTLITNVISRKKELAMLQSIGMSEKQVTKMIQGEGLYFSIVNIIVTLTLGSGAGFAVVKLMAFTGAGYMKYEFPLWYIVGYIILVILVPIIISSVSIKILRKKSLIERIREIE